MLEKLAALLEAFELRATINAVDHDVTRKKHAPSNDRNQEIRCLGDKFEVAVQMEQCVNIQETQMVGDVDSRLVWWWEVFKSYNLHRIVK